jgi:uncharacterized protein
MADFVDSTNPDPIKHNAAKSDFNSDLLKQESLRQDSLKQNLLKDGSELLPSGRSVVQPWAHLFKLKAIQRFFEPKIDFYILLVEQAETTMRGVEALEAWLAQGAAERCQIVRDLEHAADEQKMALQRKLAESFITPFDREDIYDLSVRLDEVINAAKSSAREVEALNFCPRDAALLEMARNLAEGTRCLLNAFRALQHNKAEAAAQASLARKSETRFEKVYRQAMRNLFELNDFKTILRTLEVYRTMINTATHIDIVAEKLHHVIIKIS